MFKSFAGHLFLAVVLVRVGFDLAEMAGGWWHGVLKLGRRAAKKQQRLQQQPHPLLATKRRHRPGMAARHGRITPTRATIVVQPKKGIEKYREEYVA